MQSAPESKVQLGGLAWLAGESSTIEGSQKPVHSFLGVPYAQPPVGELRFQPPKPVVLWDGVRQAKEFGSICPQSASMKKGLEEYPMIQSENESEDCLFLNVWTPTLAHDAKLPVMFWVHGGAMQIGSSDQYQGNALCTFHDVVVVSVNYRLGLLGFLCMDNDECTGNYGMLDLVEALRWVNRYISKFGGDPSNVTLFGQSAGASLCSMLSLSDLTDNLMNRVICMSGNAFMEHAVVPPAEMFKDSEPFFQANEVPSSNKDEILQYLKNVPAKKVATMDGGRFQSVIDGKVVKADPRELVKKGKYKKIDYMVGTTSQDGFFIVNMMAKGMEIDLSKLKMEDAKKIVSSALAMFLPGSEELQTKVANMYLPPDCQLEGDDLAKTVCDLFGDFMFGATSYIDAVAHSEGGSNTFLYNFEYRPSHTEHPAFVKSDHGADIYYVLGSPFHAGLVTASFTDEEREFSKTVMKYMVQFATDGLVSSDWPKFNKDTEECMSFYAEPKVEKFPISSRMPFWVDHFNKAKTT